MILRVDFDTESNIYIDIVSDMILTRSYSFDKEMRKD